MIVVSFVASTWLWVEWRVTDRVWLKMDSGGFVVEIWAKLPAGTSYASPTGLIIDSRAAYGQPEFTWWPRRARALQFDDLSVPLWMPLVVVGAPTALLWRTNRRIARLARTGHCPSCGYDRRGLTPDAPCPECGAVEVSS
jgi:predicted RNA-binding Zn-ribbon protein involved in translation (DUF1610 family)